MPSVRTRILNLFNRMRIHKVVWNKSIYYTHNRYTITIRFGLFEMEPSQHHVVKMTIDPDCIPTIPCVHIVLLEYIDGSRDRLLLPGDTIMKHISNEASAVWTTPPTTQPLSVYPWTNHIPEDHFSSYTSFEPERFKETHRILPSYTKSSSGCCCPFPWFYRRTKY